MEREQDCQARYQRMLEVEEMADDYPRIVEENQRLEDKVMEMNLME